MNRTFADENCLPGAELPMIPESDLTVFAGFGDPDEERTFNLDGKEIPHEFTE